MNTSYTLGRIGPQTIREIWEGARIGALRQALDGHDYSLGCQDCEHRVAAGDREWSTAAQYDTYAADTPGEYPRRMDFILSITCNLQCAMCDGELSSSIRMHRVRCQRSQKLSNLRLTAKPHASLPPSASGSRPVWRGLFR